MREPSTKASGWAAFAMNRPRLVAGDKAATEIAHVDDAGRAIITLGESPTILNAELARVLGDWLLDTFGGQSLVPGDPMRRGFGG